MRRKTVQITVAGEPLQVVIRPITPAALVKAGLTDMPSAFAAGGEQDLLTAVRFMHGIITAGVVAVIDSSGRRYRLFIDPSPDPDTLTPEELDEPGLSNMENTQTLFREILELSGLGDLFRAPGGEGGEGGDVGGDGPGAPQPGETLQN
ncbi:MAG: hypothetical protein ACO2OU_00155 [Thermus aquaticus]|uniref:hypothetical protein n=1 Tax=Thermus aquaticus TaxID=271 RepID=UPI003C07E125